MSSYYLPFKVNLIQEIYPIFLLACSSLAVNPCSEFSIFPTQFNTSIFIFLFVRQKTSVHFHPIIYLPQLPFKTNFIQKRSICFFVLQQPRCVFTHLPSLRSSAAVCETRVLPCFFSYATRHRYMSIQPILRVLR